MWKERNTRFGGPTVFFRVMLSHTNIYNIFQTNFGMIQHHKYNLSDLENMMPWERDIYVDMLITHIEEENIRIKEENEKIKQGGR